MSAHEGVNTRPGADARLERWLGVTLRAGVIAATTLLAIGLLLQLAGVGLGLAGLVSRVGLIVLMATPVARVVISVAEYASQRDWPFLALTLTVLAILAVSFLVGL
ncbi:MAG: putative rane protein [Acidobacteria bacterium]|nr:putative rane protein [Acidobacteriota bacterium]